MKLNLIPIVSAITLFAAGCNSSANQSGQSSNSDSTVKPVETKSPNADYKPAFAGQTRVGSVKTNTAYTVKVITDKLDRPWGIAALPDGRFLITEKKGVMRIAGPDGNVSVGITGLPTVNAAGQGGLLGLTIDPAFKTNRIVYWTFSENLPDGNLTSVARGRLSNDEKTIENATVIYRATPAYKGTLHYGSRILFDKSGSLVFSTGERSDLVTRPQSQHLHSSLGKVIRITTDGKPASGNPFANQPSARPEIYSYGHRNVQGLAMHPATGVIWEAEFGPRGGDEINLLQPGKNYGWPVITYGIEYSGEKIGGAIQQQQGLEQPVYYWDPVISPSGISFYSGDAIPEWKNNLFVTALSGMHIDRLVLKNDKVVGEERLLSKEGQRFRDITQGNDGALYTITDEGRLYRIGK